MKGLLEFVLILLVIVYIPETSFGDTDDSTLEKYLPTKTELEEMTNDNTWRYVYKNSEYNEKLGTIESITGLLRDITRIYEPINYKFKVPTILVEISQYQNQDQLESFWNESKNITLEKLFSKSYLVGSPNDFTKCVFNYSDEGAVTICVVNNLMIQSTINDSYNEHYEYKLKKIQLNQNEMTTQIMDKILQKINIDKNIDNQKDLFKVLHTKMQENKEIKSEKDVSIGLEKSNKFGIQNVSCVQDEFGLITISGQYNNNEIKKDKVDLIISFLDREGNSLVKSSINLNNIKEYENKRFIGNTFWDNSFFTCSIKLQ